MALSTMITRLPSRWCLLSRRVSDLNEWLGISKSVLKWFTLYARVKSGMHVESRLGRSQGAFYGHRVG